MRIGPINRISQGNDDVNVRVVSFDALVAVKKAEVVGGRFAIDSGRVGDWKGLVVVGLVGVVGGFPLKVPVVVEKMNFCLQ